MNNNSIPEFYQIKDPFTENLCIQLCIKADVMMQKYFPSYMPHNFQFQCPEFVFCKNPDRKWETFAYLEVFPYDDPDISYKFAWNGSHDPSLAKVLINFSDFNVNDDIIDYNVIPDDGDVSLAELETISGLDNFVMIEQKVFNTIETWTDNNEMESDFSDHDCFHQWTDDGGKNNDNGSE